MPRHRSFCVRLEMLMVMPPIKYRFDERKATQVAAYFLSHYPDRTIDRITLVKLIYYAERESFKRFGRPIFGDCYYSMKHGPVVSRVLDLMKTEVGDPDADDGYWLTHIHKGDGPTVVLVDDPGCDDLAPIELEILEQVYSQRKDRTTWQIRDESHDLPEWKDPGTSCLPISVEDLLVALGKSEAEIQAIAQDALERQFFRSVFDK